MEKTIDLGRATKQELLELIRKLRRRREDHYILQENGKPLAVVISRAAYERYREEQRQKAAEELRQFLQEMQSKMDHGYSEEEVERDVLEAIHEVRKLGRK